MYIDALKLIGAIIVSCGIAYGLVGGLMALFMGIIAWNIIGWHWISWIIFGIISISILGKFIEEDML